MDNVHFLDIPFGIFAPTVTIDYFSKEWIANIDWNKSFSQELLDFFDHRNLKIIHAESFFNRAGTPKTVIHSDRGLGDYTKINFVYGNGNSKMCWYCLNGGKIPRPTRTRINTLSTKVTEREVTLVESRSIIKPALVQVGVPHNIVNIDQDRLCLSIVFVDKITNRRPTMSESCKIFESSLASPPGIEPGSTL